MLSGASTKNNNQSSWRRSFAVGFAVWTIVGLSFGTRTYLFYSRQSLDFSFLPVIYTYLIAYYLWGLASPLIFALSRRYLIERGNLAIRFALHFAAAFVFTFVMNNLSTAIFWYVGLADYTKNQTLTELYSKSVLSPILVHEGLLTYWGTTIAAHAYEYYRRGRETEREAARLETETAQLAAQTAELSGQLAQAQLSALKMQLHPHFLFNTLNSIASLLHKDTEMAHRMIARLSDFLRMTLKSSETHSVTLEEELGFLNTYLEIEKIRFQERLMIEMQIEPETLAAQVPNLLLQPIVENAVRHGLSNTSLTGKLKISAQRSDDKIRIQVEDNGPGFGKKIKSGKSAAQNGVGLANTKARLERFYGGDFNFEITSKNDSPGTIVLIEFPFLV